LLNILLKTTTTTTTTTTDVLKMASIPPRDEVIDASSAWESATEARAPPKDVMKDALKKEEQIRWE
jgi:hypothetical protein